MSVSTSSAPTPAEREREEQEQDQQRRLELAVLDTIREMGDKIRSEAETNWHFSIEAPRWAVRSPRGNTTTSVVAGVAAFLMAGFAFWLAWHATDKLIGSQSALTVQIGPWASVGA